MYRRSLIYNPIAGRLRRNPDLIRAVLDVLGPDVQPVPTTGPNTATVLAREAIEKGSRHIIAFGGDGTVNEVANGMVSSDVPLSILPGGTANVLHSEFDLPDKPLASAHDLKNLKPQRVAAGRIRNEQGERHFLMMAGAGLDAQIVLDVTPELKRTLGKVAYWAGGFSSVARRLPEFDISTGDQHMRGSFALVTRVRNYGGDLEIAKNIRLTDPAFELLAFEGKWAPVYLKYFSGVLLGNVSRMSGVTSLRTLSVELGPRVPLQIDGEFAGYTPATIEIVPDALTVMMPSNYGGDAWT